MSSEDKAKSDFHNIITEELAGFSVDLKKSDTGILLSASLTEPRAKSEKSDSEDEPIVTHHQINVGDRTLSYKVTTGLMPIKSEEGETEANIFFMAYTLDSVTNDEARPLMFSFNGGPGSASVWLHMGALGPRRVAMLPDGNLPPPPYKLEDNPATWLDKTDIVFIDPVGTGFSRPTKPEYGKKFWGLNGDIESVGEFIRLYLVRYERWASPLFLVGESYGTTRASGLAGHLVEKGIALNGVLLVSTVLNFQTLDFAHGNDLPYSLFLPTYCATAWYHNKLSDDLQSDFKKTLAEVEQFCITEYTVALAKGDALAAEERDSIAERVSRYTGVSKEFVLQSNLRLNIFRFCKELLRSENRTVGRLDSRLKGFDRSTTTPEPEFDPSMTAIMPPYTSMFNHYVRAELGYKSDVEYHILGTGIKSPWDFGDSGNGYANVSESLRMAFAKNPYMKVFVANGYYDLATPYFATIYTLAHMELEPTLKSHITVADYEAGHMMYINVDCLKKLKKDVAVFIDKALKP